MQITFLQTTDSKKPTLITNSNKQYLSFDGSDDSLAGDFAGHVLDDPSGQNVTIFTVVKPKGGLYILSTGGQAGNSKGYALSYQDYGGINSFSIFRDSSGSRELSIVDSFEANDIHLVTHSYAGSYSKTHVLIDGKSSGNNYSDSSGASTNIHQELTIGDPGYDKYYGDFEIAEVIVISSTNLKKLKIFNTIFQINGDLLLVWTVMGMVLLILEKLQMDHLQRIHQACRVI